VGRKGCALAAVLGAEATVGLAAGAAAGGVLIGRDLPFPLAGVSRGRTAAASPDPGGSRPAPAGGYGRQVRPTRTLGTSTG